MVPSIARIHNLLKVKVKVKGHVIRALLWCHEMFAIQHRLTFCLYMHSLCEVPLHCPSTIKCQAARCNVYIMESATPSFSMCQTLLVSVSYAQVLCLDIRHRRCWVECTYSCHDLALRIVCLDTLSVCFDVRTSVVWLTMPVCVSLRHCLYRCRP